MNDALGQAMLAELVRIRELLERRAPRDERHAALVQAIAAAAGSAAFTSAELIAHAQIEGALRTAILASCAELNGRKLGRLLRRIEGADSLGWTIERCGADSSGVIWSVKPSKPIRAVA